MAKRERGSRVDLYHLIWIFLIASVIGYVLETVFCLVIDGKLESRQGLLYGPICQVYGMGAVAMVLMLRPFAKRGNLWLFFGSFLLGGVFEFACSLFQERLYGTVSWDYTGQPFSIWGGRTSLVFMFFWGILGLWFIRSVYPKLNSSIDRVPRRYGRPLTVVVSIFLCLNILVSSAAVSRWNERQQSVPAANEYEAYLDQQYPDDYMERIYPNMAPVAKLR